MPWGNKQNPEAYFKGNNLTQFNYFDLTCAQLFNNKSFINLGINDWTQLSPFYPVSHEDITQRDNYENTDIFPASAAGRGLERELT
jgi:hypothetical protein